MSKYHYNKFDGEAPIKAWVDGVDFAANAEQQLRNIAKMPFIHKHVAAMPDVHLGKGATVGSVICTKGAIIPAAVGVDIGCGMMARRTGLTSKDLPENLAGVRAAIEKAVPHGRSDNGGANDRGGWGNIPEGIGHMWQAMVPELQEIQAQYPDMRPANDVKHLGTLGTGNHFIEVCLDEEDRVWIMLHSGSRGIGNRIGSFFISNAQREMEKWFIHLPDRDLAYIPEGSEHFYWYTKAVSWAQNYARVNREVMMRAATFAIEHELGRQLNLQEEAINCHHNYVDKENHFGSNVFVTRKGAVRARTGDLGIIPGSMGARSYIVSGKGNPDSFHSCSHGAGRVMSRGQARRNITVEDHIKATEGVECRKDAEVVDESPAAYKDIDAVMAAQSDLVSIVHTLKQVVCVKG